MFEVQSEFDFSIAFTAAVLPLEILSFDVSNDDNNVDLCWTTTNEKNIDYFVVERIYEADEVFQEVS